jgi:cobalamin biosynthesis protein CobW
MLNGSKIPATVITGFLGAGKTTLIRHMLANAKGKRIALIINEFGDLGVDGDVLKGCGDEVCSEEDIVELNNGCICCTVADDFIPTMEKLLARKDRPDHIVIETSGLGPSAAAGRGVQLARHQDAGHRGRGRHRGRQRGRRSWPLRP